MDSKSSGGSRHNRWINYCLKIAKKSAAPEHKHAAALVKGGRLIAYGVNNYRKSGIIADAIYGNRKWHSETDVLCKVSEEDTEGAILYIAGWTKGGNLVCSKPCDCCQKFIKKYQGLKAIYYCNDIGEPVKMVI